MSILSKGYPKDGVWVFGGIERGSGKCFLTVVDKRDKATLIPLIKKWILPGDLHTFFPHLSFRKSKCSYHGL